MPITPPLPTPAPIAYYASDIITDAFIEIGAWAPGEDVNQYPDESQWALRKLNYLLDTWAARNNFVYATTIFTYTLVPNLQPHTIGPSPTATFKVAQRPVKIEYATVILNNVSPNVEIPLTPRDDEWWMNQTIKELTSQQPTDFYYSAGFPDGQIYYWPKPIVAWGTRLQVWALLSQFTAITDELGGPGTGITAIPPGYRNALMLTLAETLLPASKKEAHPVLVAAASEARRAVFGNNSQSIRMATRDSGIPGGNNSLRDSNFNWRSRSSF